MQTKFDINVGVDDYVLPTIEGCLKDYDGKFYSLQNAIRVHEWLRGTEVTPLALEAVKPSADGTFELRTLGKPKVAGYPEKYRPGWLLLTEQVLIATPAVSDLLKSNLKLVDENKSIEFVEALGDTAKKLMEITTPLIAFNASCMYFQQPFPKRFIHETLTVLDVLMTCVLTQRDRIAVKPYPESDVNYPLQLYKHVDLDMVISRVSQGDASGCFPNPEIQALEDSLLDGGFFRECAMAFSAYSGVRIPRHYITEPGRIYYWAVTVLTSLRDKVPEYQVRPKPQSVVNIFSRK